MAQSLLMIGQIHRERPPVYSVTPEAPTNLSFQAPPQRSVRSDQSSGNDSFGALVDSSTGTDAGNGRPTSTALQQSASQHRSDDAAPTADNTRSRDTAPADQAARNNSDNRD